MFLGFHRYDMFRNNLFIYQASLACLPLGCYSCLTLIRVFVSYLQPNRRYPVKELFVSRCLFRVVHSDNEHDIDQRQYLFFEY